MKTSNFLTSACRLCRYYKPEGRRGGMCQQLGAPVRGSWNACKLALPAFAPSWETIEEVLVWQNEKLKLSKTFTTTDLDRSHVERVVRKNSLTTENQSADAILV
ncbi:MAG: hypothetical protein KME06_21045 [Kastovskya adunca ATA6-11-RM4]|jgi:hypothetical protein|nr:hypothetical protein [Kastovskya adunca ATA6-11-RM4]